MIIFGGQEQRSRHTALINTCNNISSGYDLNSSADILKNEASGFPDCYSLHLNHLNHADCDVIHGHHRNSPRCPAGYDGWVAPLDQMDTIPLDDEQVATVTIKMNNNQRHDNYNSESIDTKL